MSTRKEQYDGPLTNEEVKRLAEVFVRRVGARIREFREMHGLSIATVRDEHGINVSQLSRIENGKMNLTTKTAVRLAKILGVQPWDFYVPRELAPDLRPKRRRRTPPSDESLERAHQAFQKQIGSRVRELRELQGMSLMSLEAFSGIDVPKLRMVEAGKANIRASTAIRLADAIGVQPHELYIPAEQSGIRLRSGDTDDA
ncbi:MAG TPA: helix-turn-helix transcriptional regulator [Sandaracinaceae bacterium LLY-WYZ-13_1]|nr:helix-turn-helix transcriptional regulator [Sandaracinaceae bacterium LLY-WYZ-13_1]